MRRTRVPTPRRDVRGVEGARLESVCRGNPPTVGSNPTLSAKSSHSLRLCGARGIQALRRCGGFGLESRQPPWAFGFDCAARVGFRHSAAVAASGSNPGNHPGHSLRLCGARGIQALRRCGGFGLESRQPPWAFGCDCAARVGFRHSAAVAASGSNPGNHPGHSLRLCGARGIQALRRCGGFGLESLPPPWAFAPPPPRLDRTVGATYTGASARGDGSRRGSEPVQFQPTNRVRAGRQQR